MRNKKIKTVLYAGVAVLCMSVLGFTAGRTIWEKTEEVQINTTNDINDIFDNTKAKIDNTKVEITESINDHIYVITDPKTGVQYIVYREKVVNAGLSGITPRLNSDGTLMIVETPDETSANLS